MEMRREESFVTSVFRAKFCSIETSVCDSRTRAEQQHHAEQHHAGQQHAGDDPQDERVKPAEPTAQSPFSLLLQFFRIFLLIYHSVKWNEVMQTTGQSKYDDLDLCDWCQQIKQTKCSYIICDECEDTSNKRLQQTHFEQIHATTMVTTQNIGLCGKIVWISTT